VDEKYPSRPARSLVTITTELPGAPYKYTYETSQPVLRNSCKLISSELVT
jgi:hypothetical protein